MGKETAKREEERERVGRDEDEGEDEDEGGGGERESGDGRRTSSTITKGGFGERRREQDVEGAGLL
jgi:hypothetical protein